MYTFPLLTISYLLSVFTLTSATSPGVISPANGAHIAPGRKFDFKYNTMADYGISTYNYTVWLFTSKPTAMSALGLTDTFTTGWYFGRFAAPNYPSNPYPDNLPPAQLTMPDFSKPPGGFGSGATAHDKDMYFAVMEEWANSHGVLGRRFALSVNQIVYNSTH